MDLRDPRQVTRRRARPNGRVVLGGFLIALAAVVVFAASLRGTFGSHWVVAARPLAAGTVVSAGDLTTSVMRLPGPARAQAFGEPGPLLGRTLAVGMQPGELLESTMLVPSGQDPALRPVSIAVDPTSLTGLAPGALVDVLSSAGEPGSTTVSVVLRGVTLIEVSRSGSSLLSGPSGAEVTLGVASLAEVEAAVAAAHTGTVTLVAAEPSDGTGLGPGR